MQENGLNMVSFLYNNIKKRLQFVFPQSIKDQTLFQDTLSQLSGYNVPSLPATTEPCTLGEIRSAVDDLRQCWQQVEGQIDDWDRHL